MNAPRRPLCACGKLPYATRAEAKARQPKMRVYLCPIGGVYHVRSRVSRRQRGG